MSSVLHPGILLLLALASSLVAETPRALPVDPSDITPDSGLSPVEPVLVMPS